MHQNSSIFEEVTFPVIFKPQTTKLLFEAYLVLKKYFSKPFWDREKSKPPTQRSQKARTACTFIFPGTPGWGFTKLLTKICKIFCNFGPSNLNIIYKYFLKHISLKSDFNYCINHKVPIFFDRILCKSTLKLQKKSCEFT